MDSYDVGVFLIRLITGGFFFGHGGQMLLGWFGGGGMQRTRPSFQRMGFRPALPFALMASGSQFFCGAAVVLGILWPLPAVLLVGTMLVAVIQIHYPKIWVTEQGMEYPMVMGAVMAGIGLLSVGEISLDNAFNIDLAHMPAYWAGLAVSVVGALSAIVSARMGKKAAEAAAATAPTPTDSAPTAS